MVNYKVIATVEGKERGFEVAVGKEDTWRDLLGPEYAHLIQIGSHRLLDDKGNPLNIDSLILPEHCDKNGKIQFEIEPRKTKSIWVTKYPVLRKRAVLFLAGSEKNVLSFRQILDLLQQQGIASAGFRSIDSLERVWYSDIIQSNMEACGLLADREGYMMLGGSIKKLEEKQKKTQLFRGYAFAHDEKPEEKVLRDLPFMVPMFSSTPASDFPELICGRIVSALNFDIDCISTLDKKEKKNIYGKSEEWIQRVEGFFGKDLNEGLTHFLWNWLEQYVGNKTLDEYFVNKLVSDTELSIFREIVGGEPFNKDSIKTSEIVGALLPWAA